MCGKLCSAMYMAKAFPASTHFIKKKTPVTWQGDGLQNEFDQNSS